MLSSVEHCLYNFFTEILPVGLTSLTFISHLEKGL